MAQQPEEELGITKMNQNGKRVWGDLLRHDLPASVVVFLVALPLCMGIAIASGVPVAAGLITGIVGGLIVGWLAGCPLQVSGPAAGLTVVVYDAIQTYGLQALGLIVLLAGLIQIAAGALRLGQWFRAVSPAVIKGMLAGIGFLIMASQFHVMMDDKPKGSGAENLIAIPAAIEKGLALPEFNNRGGRRVRSRALHEIGEVHRSQLQIQEKIFATRGPDDHDDTDVRHKNVPADLTEMLRSQQRDVTLRLNEAVARLRNSSSELGNQTNQSRILAAADNSLRQSESAGQSLGDGSLDTALETQQAAVESLESLLANLKNHQLAAYIGVLTIILIVIWQTCAPKRFKIVPAPLFAIVIAAVLAAVVTLPVLYVEVPANLWDDVRLPSWSAFSSSWAQLLPVALLMAVVASAETLLCATAVDRIHHGTRTKYDRELIAQGVGNGVCGFLGALPMTGVIVRSSANVQAGAKSRISTVLHGVWLLLFVVALAFVLHSIPTASLAAMLVYTGYKLVDIKSVRELQRYGWGEVAIYAATVGMIVFTDLLTGVLVGVGLSAAKLLYRFSHLESQLDVNLTDDTAVLQLHGAATFVRLPVLAAELERVPAGAELHVNFEHLEYIDHACLELLTNWARQHESAGGQLVIDWSSLHARFARDKNGIGKDRPSNRHSDIENSRTNTMAS